MGERIIITTMRGGSHGMAGSHITGEFEVEVGVKPVRVEIDENEFIEIRQNLETGGLSAVHIYQEGNGLQYGTGRVQVDNGHSLGLFGHNSASFERIDEETSS